MSDQEEEIEVRDDNAAEFEEWYLTKGVLYDWVEKTTIIDALDIQPGDVVLDAGCGTGRFSREIAKRCHKVYGVDFSSISIDMLNKKLLEDGIQNVEALVGDITKPLPINQPVDKIISVQVIQHIPTEDARHKVLENLSMHLRVGGICVIAVYNHNRLFRGKTSKEGKFPSSIYYHRFIPEELESMFRKGGFKQYSVKGCVNFRWYSLLNNRNLYWLLYPIAWLDILLSKVGLSCSLGAYLVCKGIK